MITNHPITPPPELISGWLHEAADLHLPIPANLDYLATRAAQWGADQELGACCECLDSWGDIHNSYGYELASDLRAARRPKPPSLKEQALKTVNEMSDCMSAGFVPKRSDLDAIRRALEALPE